MFSEKIEKSRLRVAFFNASHLQFYEPGNHFRCTGIF